VTPRLTVSELFERGFRRNRAAPLPIEGATVPDADGNTIGARLHKVAKDKGILLMGCDQCCYEREIADKLFAGVPIGCVPDLYKAPSGNIPDQVITL